MARMVRFVCGGCMPVSKFTYPCVGGLAGFVGSHVSACTSNEMTSPRTKVEERGKLVLGSIIMGVVGIGLATHLHVTGNLSGGQRRSLRRIGRPVQVGVVVDNDQLGAKERVQ